MAQDLGGGPLLTALCWLMSSGLRRRAARHAARYRLLFRHASGAELAELVALV